MRPSGGCGPIEAMSRLSTSRDAVAGKDAVALLANHSQANDCLGAQRVERCASCCATSAAGDQIVRGRADVAAARCMREGRQCSGQGCRCRRGELHGPYTYLAVYVDGRSRLMYVPADDHRAHRVAPAGRAAQRGAAGGDLAGQPGAAPAAGAAVMSGGRHRRRSDDRRREHARRRGDGAGGAR